MRALPPSAPRRLLIAFLHTRYVRIITSPLFTIPLFIASLYGLYFTPLFDFLMESRTGHIAMMIHFLAVGLVFFWPIMGVDPGPHRSGHVIRLLELFATMPFHAFFGIADDGHRAHGDHVRRPARLPGHRRLADQSAAGGIAWAFSEIPTVLVLVAWSSSGGPPRSARHAGRTARRTAPTTRRCPTTTRTWPLSRSSHEPRAPDPPGRPHVNPGVIVRARSVPRVDARCEAAHERPVTSEAR